MRRILSGIDIGSSVTIVVSAELQSGGTLKLLGAGSAPSAGLRRGAVVNAEEASRSVGRAVVEAETESGVRIRSAILGIGGPSVGVFPARGVVAVSRADGEVTEEDTVRARVAAEGMIPKNPNREILDVLARSYKVDGLAALTDPIGLVGMKLELEAVVVDAARQPLENAVRACELAGVAVDGWASSILAAAEVLLTPAHKELGTLLLDLGAGTTDYAVFEDGGLVDLGAFPLGGNHITMDVAIGLRISVLIAEAIKLRYASELLSARAARRTEIPLVEFTPGDERMVALADLSDIVEARLTDVLELAGKSLKRIGRAGLLPGGVVLSGGVVELGGIAELARRELKLPVEVVRQFRLEGMEEPVASRYAVPVGLILWELKREGQRRGRVRWSAGIERIARLLRGLIP